MSSNGSSRRRMALRRRIHRVLHDTDSGAAEIATTAARIFAEAVTLGYSPKRIERLANQLTHAHPAMAPVWHLAHTDDPLQFASQLRDRTRATIRLARSSLPKTGSALTLSYSSTVIAAIARKGRRCYVAESLPGGEGARTARAMKKMGVKAEVIPDSAIMSAAPQATFGIIGADAVTPGWIINKVGSYLLALACREKEIPFFVVADSSKFVPNEWTMPSYGTSQPFESVPRSLVTKVISDALDD